MTSSIPYNKNLIKIKPYEPGKSNSKQRLGFPLIKLSSNEACLSFSEPIQKKINNVNIKLSQYPDGQAEKLRNKISKQYK
ncbi:MAG: histidinol-phosphate transaminase, partial [Pseudomonadota bacterium]|nr:histidinol-phosphate transaminase [Pseudomonadota bacterium]